MDDAGEERALAVGEELPTPALQAQFMGRALDLGWGVRGEVRRVGEIIYSKIKITPSHRPEPPHERKQRMLVQGMINLADWTDVRWVQHAVDPESGETLIDEFVMPSQWQQLLGPGYGEERYHVVLTPSGCRCNCPFAEQAAKPTELTPWGEQETGSTAPCPHSELARFIMRYGLVVPPPPP